MDAGFLSVVEIGQYFMTQDNGEQFYAKACREYTLPREDGSSQPRCDGSRETQKQGPVLKGTTSCLHGKHGVETSQSGLWVKTTLTPGLKFLMHQINLWWIRITTTLKFTEDSALKNEALRTGCESILHADQRQQAKPQEDGAVHFWRIKENLQNQFPQIPHWSGNRWKACLAAGRWAKRRYQYCTDDSGTIVYLRALQGHSGRNLIDPSLQDNVVIQSGFFQHIYHIGCAFNLHSIINNGLISGGQNSSKRQTVFFLLIDPWDKEHKDPEKIDLTVPRRAQYLHNAWKKHQDAVYWVDIDLAIRKGLTFDQTRSNAIILQGILPAYCIPKVVRLKTGEVFFEKAYMSPRPPPKIWSLDRHDWTKGIGFESWSTTRR